ncbi:hypothetical protein BH10ACT3_BH10ACT3_07840 [soil metagenome]
MHGMRPRTLLLALLTVAAVVGLAACGSDEANGTTGATSSSSPDPGTAASGVTITLASTDLGDVLADGEGNVLYLFTPDATGAPTCVDACATTWPPLVSSGEPDVDGVASRVISTVATADGSTQVTAGGHPLYAYSGDSAPGDIAGQGSGGKWFVVSADGTPIETLAGTDTVTTTTSIGTTTTKDATSGY